MDEPIKRLFQLWTCMGRKNHVLAHGPDPPRGRDDFGVDMSGAIVKYREQIQSSVQRWLTRLRCCLGCVHGWAQGTTC